jgi:hypothetical protein
MPANAACRAGRPPSPLAMSILSRLSLFSPFDPLAPNDAIAAVASGLPGSRLSTFAYAAAAAFELPSRAAIVAAPIKASTLFGSSSSAAKYSVCAFAILPVPSARYPACTCRSIGDGPSDRATEKVAIEARAALPRRATKVTLGGGAAPAGGIAILLRKSISGAFPV